MNVNSEELNALIDSNELVVVDFWAQWCGPCKIMGPKFDELAANNPGANIKKLEIDKHPDAAQQFAVRNIPTFIFFKNGEEVDRLFGTQSVEQLQAKVDEYGV